MFYIYVTPTGIEISTPLREVRLDPSFFRIVDPNNNSSYQIGISNATLGYRFDFGFVGAPPLTQATVSAFGVTGLSAANLSLTPTSASVDLIGTNWGEGSRAVITFFSPSASPAPEPSGPILAGCVVLAAAVFRAARGRGRPVPVRGDSWKTARKIKGRANEGTS